MRTTIPVWLALSDGAAVDAVQVQSVWDFVVKGGPMMIPIVLCSLVALALFVERTLSLRRGRVIPPEFVPGLREVLGGGLEDQQRALDYCTRAGNGVAAVFSAGIKKLGAPLAVLEKAIEEAGQRVTLQLRKYLRVFSLIAAICPLMGLLGTIFGMITAFQTVALSAEALGKTELLARGIYQALITTAAGLLVAIPVLIAHHWIAARIERRVSEMDQLMLEFVEEYGETHCPGAARASASADPAVCGLAAVAPSTPAAAPG